MKYKIVADSSANVYSLADVAFSSVPLKILTSSQEYVDNSRLDISHMVANLKAEKTGASTSCPNMTDWYEAIKDGENVFVLSLTSQLSGSYNAALQAAGEFKRNYPERRIWVLDTRSTGPEMLLIIEKLRECILANKTFEEIRKTTREYSKHTHLLFNLQSMENLAKNGRCSMALAKVAGVLGIRVVGRASSEGVLEPLSKPRGEQKSLEFMLSEMARSGFRGGKARISHCFNLKAAQKLQTMILDCFPGSDVTIDCCGGLCSYYADLGGLLVGFEDDLP